MKEIITDVLAAAAAAAAASNIRLLYSVALPLCSTALRYATMVSMGPLHKYMIPFGAIIDLFVPSLPQYTPNE